MLLCLCLFPARPVKFGVEGVEILFIEPIGQQPQVLAEALVVHHLALTQEADRVLHVIVVRQTQDVVIRRARLLLCKGFVCTTYFLGEIRSLMRFFGTYRMFFRSVKKLSYFVFRDNMLSSIKNSNRY